MENLVMKNEDFASRMVIGKHSESIGVKDFTNRRSLIEGRFIDFYLCAATEKVGMTPLLERKHLKQ